MSALRDWDRGTTALAVDEVAARVHYLQALTALFAREGTLLTRRGVALEIEEEKES